MKNLILSIHFLLALMVLSCSDGDRIASALEGDKQLPDGSAVPFLLYQNYPNPFNPSTSIEYQLGSTLRVRLRVMTEDWVEVSTLVNQLQSVGRYRVVFSAADIPSGEYLCVMEAGGVTQIRRMTLLK